MELSHSFTVPASVEQTWQTFMDLQEVGGCFPGATVTEVTDDGFSGTVKVKLGPISLLYAGSGAFVERDDTAHRAVIEAKGKDKRGNGTAGATVKMELFDAGGGSTRAEVATDLSVTGKPAQFGRGIMQDVSDKLLSQFIACIEAQLGAPAPASSEPVGTMPTEPAGTTPTEPASLSPTEPARGEPAAGPPTGGPVRAQDAAVDAQIPATRTAPVPAPAARTAAASDDALDLGSTLLPVVLRTYGKPLALGLATLLVITWLVRRARPRRR